MRFGLAFWLAGWLFVMGWIGHDELAKNPNWKMRWQDEIKLSIFWPVFVGYEYAEHRGDIIK